MKKLTKVELKTAELLVSRAHQFGQNIPGVIFAHDLQTAAPVVGTSLVQQTTQAGWVQSQPEVPNKYERTVCDMHSSASVSADVYTVLESFKVTCPALQHLVKKALCVGIRGHKDVNQDLQDIAGAAQRAIELQNRRG